MGAAAPGSRRLVGRAEGLSPLGGGPNQPSSSCHEVLTPARSLGGPGLRWQLSFLF